MISNIYCFRGRVPSLLKIMEGKFMKNIQKISAKEIILNSLEEFGCSKLYITNNVLYSDRTKNTVKINDIRHLDTNIRTGDITVIINTGDVLVIDFQCEVIELISNLLKEWEEYFKAASYNCSTYTP